MCFAVDLAFLFFIIINHQNNYAIFPPYARLIGSLRLFIAYPISDGEFFRLLSTPQCNLNEELRNSRHLYEKIS